MLNNGRIWSVENLGDNTKLIGLITFLRNDYMRKNVKMFEKIFRHVGGYLNVIQYLGAGVKLEQTHTCWSGAR